MDESRLPREVAGLRPQGLEIRVTADIGPYKKIIPALGAFPAAFIVTADDDIYYRRRWLEELVRGWDGRRNLIVCHRAHKITYEPDGRMRPYRNWIFDNKAREESADLFPTGSGGVLYPPRALAPEVLDEECFKSLSPRNDDIWLYWMGRRAGARYRTIGRPREFTSWPKSQQVGLYIDNVLGGDNDVQIRNMIERFGQPCAQGGGGKYGNGA